jgi:hypothetical protein
MCSADRARFPARGRSPSAAGFAGGDAEIDLREKRGEGFARLSGRMGICGVGTGPRCGEATAVSDRRAGVRGGGDRGEAIHSAAVAKSPPVRAAM